MLADAKEYLRKLQLLKENPHHQEDADYVQKHIDIMEYLIDCAEEVECNISHEEELPVLPEVSE